MKQKIKQTKWYHLLLMTVLAAVLVFSCRKLDSKSNILTDAEIESKFFNKNRSSEIVESKIVNFLQNKNNKHNFINKTVERIGYPAWNKMIKVGNETGANFKGNTNDDSIVVAFIPFVRESQNVVNACLKIKMTPSDTSYSYICDWQYHDSASVGLSARKQSLLLMQLNKNVFGSRLYKITDSAAFGVNSANKAVKYVKLQSSNQQITGGKVNSTNKTNLVLMVFTICDVILVPKHEGQLTGCEPGDPNCNDYVEELDCQNYYIWASEGGGGDNGGNEGDSGYGDNSGSGGSDDGTPPPCNGSAGGRTSNVTNPCTPGWEPLEDGNTNNPTPCEISNNLKNDSVSISKFKYLQTLVNGNHEEVFTIPQYSSDTIKHFIGNTGDKKVKSTITSPIKCHLHNHYNDPDELSLFSSSDFNTIAVLFANQKVIPQVFTMGVTTSFGTNYVIVIDNPTAFTYFMNNYIFSDGANKELSDLYIEYGIHHSSTIAENELAMLQLLKDQNAGVKLLRSDANFSQFEELGLNRDGTVVVPIPCN